MLVFEGNGEGYGLIGIGRVPHISLVFREIWDTTDVDC
jgi:hypothetical protein